MIRFIPLSFFLMTALACERPTPQPSTLLAETTIQATQRPESWAKQQTKISRDIDAKTTGEPSESRDLLISAEGSSTQAHRIDGKIVKIVVAAMGETYESNHVLYYSGEHPVLMEHTQVRDHTRMMSPEEKKEAGLQDEKPITEKRVVIFKQGRVVHTDFTLDGALKKEDDAALEKQSIYNAQFAHALLTLFNTPDKTECQWRCAGEELTCPSFECVPK